jgi:hypothetical protein
MKTLLTEATTRLFFGLCLVAAWSACGVSTTVEDHYAKACTVAADCRPAFFGDVCQACTCANGAIAQSAQAVLDADTNQAKAACGAQPAIACGPCPSPVVVCNAGRCQLSP